VQEPLNRAFISAPEGAKKGRAAGRTSPSDGRFTVVRIITIRSGADLIAHVAARLGSTDRLAVDRALTLDPAYRLALLLDAALNALIAPGWLTAH